MSSSTSIAAARNRRAGSQAPPPSQSRPGTSIASQSAFAQQNGNRNSRMQQSSMQKPVNNTQHDNGLPFTKLTVSDAVGLITLRLGRVEQFIIDLQEERNNGGSSMGNLPENTKLIDNSVLTSIINRLDTLEKKNLTSGNNEQITKLEKELKEAKDHLLNIILKLEKHITETNNKFTDVETSLSNLESSLPVIDADDNLLDSNLSLNNISLEVGELNNDDNGESHLTQEA